MTIELLAGRTRQQLQRLLDSDSAYTVTTPGMVLAARGTQFEIRVEPNGRSAMLVSEGNVEAEADATQSEVGAEFGIRSQVDGPLSDVVRASTFEELDSALDGCTGTIHLMDDASLNVRLSPSLDAFRVGTIEPQDVSTLFGRYTGESQIWHRIAFRGNYGWILANDVSIDDGCPGIREFDGDYSEDIQLYEFLGDPIELEDMETSTDSGSTESDTSSG